MIKVYCLFLSSVDFRSFLLNNNMSSNMFTEHNYLRFPSLRRPGATHDCGLPFKLLSTLSSRRRSRGSSFVSGASRAQWTAYLSYFERSDKGSL